MVAREPGGLPRLHLHLFSCFELHYLWRQSLADEDDHLVLEAAMASSSPVIVTFNKRDLAPAEKMGISLMTPKEFMLSLRL
jgi:predicted nucleic acid-binding protein